MHRIRTWPSLYIGQEDPIFAQVLADIRVQSLKKDTKNALDKIPFHLCCQS